MQGPHAGGGGPPGGPGPGGIASHIQRRTARPTRPVWPTIRRALTLLRPHRLMVGMYLVTVVFTSLTGLVQPLLFQPIVDRAIPNHDVSLLTLLCFELLVLVLASSLVGVLRSYLSNRTGQDVVY